MFEQVSDLEEEEKGIVEFEGNTLVSGKDLCVSEVRLNHFSFYYFLNF